MLDKRSPTETRLWRKTDSNSRSLREGKGYEESLMRASLSQVSTVSASASRALPDWQCREEPFTGAGPNPVPSSM